MGCLGKLLNTAIITWFAMRILIGKNKRRVEDMPWVGVKKKRFDSTMFKLRY